jgi:hypothetical protein
VALVLGSLLVLAAFAAKPSRFNGMTSLARTRTANRARARS